jgi:four helix bundle protein
MPNFAHHRLEAYHAALDLAAAGHRLAGRMPRGHGWLADHLIRAACAVPVLTAEGAPRTSPGSKRQRFSEALGECGEAAAVAELVERLALVRGDEPAAVLKQAGRTVALLTGLVRKFA